MTDFEDNLSDVNSLISYSDATIRSFDNMSVKSGTDWPDLQQFESQDNAAGKEPPSQATNLRTEGKDTPDTRELNENESSDKDIDILVSNTIKSVTEEAWAVDSTRSNNNDNDDNNDRTAKEQDQNSNDNTEENEESEEGALDLDSAATLIAEEHPFLKSITYLEKHGIFRLFQNFSADIVHHRPDHPLQFMVDQLKQLKDGESYETR